MEKILIATDFSKASENALIYGVRLAKSLDASVVLFSCYEYISPPANQVQLLMTTQELRDRTLLRLAQMTDHLSGGDRARVEILCKNGHAAEAIVETARETGAGLIIAGMKKAWKGVRRVLGSTVTELARKTSIPMVVVPEQAGFNGVTSIALASEQDLMQDAETNVLLMLKEIAGRFQSRLFIVRVAEPNVNQACELVDEPRDLINAVRELAPIYKQIAGKSIPEALNEFIAQYHIDLLALLPHKHSLLERLFFKSATRSMIFETDVPLLIIPDKRAALDSHTSSHWEQIIL